MAWALGARAPGSCWQDRVERHRCVSDSAHVLELAGNPAAEVADALARLPNSAEAKQYSARARAPLFALQASFLVAMVAAWMLMALAFSIDAPVVRKSAALAVGVVSASAILLRPWVAHEGRVTRPCTHSVRPIGVCSHSRGSHWLAPYWPPGRQPFSRGSSQP